ncbi:MAG: Ig-like domain-containing protein, partial [Rubrivivax sp.]
SAPAAGQVSEWFAFVTTRLLNFELASLELGQPSHAGVSLSATFPEAVLAGEAATFTVTAVDPSGQPSAGLHVGIEVDGGTVSRASGETDGSGMFTTQATLGPGSPRITLTATVREAPDGEVIEVLTRSATAPGPGSVRLLRRWDGLTETGLARFRVIASFGHDGRAPAQVFYDLDEDGPASQQDFSGRTVSLTARGTGAYDGTSASAEAQGTHTVTLRVVDGSLLGIDHGTRFSASATMTNPPPYPNPVPGSITHVASAFGAADLQSCVDFRVEGQDVRYVLELTGSTAKSMFLATRLTPIGGGARLVDYSASGATHALSREGVLPSGGSYTFCLYLTGKALWESYRRVQLQSALDGQLEVRFTLVPVPPP